MIQWSPSTFALLLVICGSLTEARKHKCMQYKVDKFYLEQCGYHMPVMIACDIHGTRVDIGDRIHYNRHLYCCAKTGEVEHKIEKIKPQVCGCYKDNKEFNVGDKANYYNAIEMTCMEQPKGITMVITGCVYKGENIALGSSKPFRDAEYECAKDKKSGQIKVNLKGCYANGKSLKKDEETTFDKFKWKCQIRYYVAKVIKTGCKFGRDFMEPETTKRHGSYEYKCQGGKKDMELVPYACYLMEEQILFGKIYDYHGQKVLCNLDEEGTFKMRLA